jgi:hypothetical protein
MIVFLNEFIVYLLHGSIPDYGLDTLEFEFEQFVFFVDKRTVFGTILVKLAKFGGDSLQFANDQIFEISFSVEYFFI